MKRHSKMTVLLTVVGTVVAVPVALAAYAWWKLGQVYRSSIDFEDEDFDCCNKDEIEDNFDDCIC